MLVILGLALAGCSNTPPPMGAPPPISFADEKPYAFDVARVEIVSKYVAPSTPPHIEYELAASPENALRRWAQDRLQPKGTVGTLRVVINDASATEVTLPKDPNASTLFNNGPQSKIDMSLDVSLQMLDDRQFVVSEVTGKSMRSQTLATDLKLNERDKILRDMVVDLVKGFGQQVDPQIRTAFQKNLIF
jgi:hypothetical protein